MEFYKVFGRKWANVQKWSGCEWKENKDFLLKCIYTQNISRPRLKSNVEALITIKEHFLLSCKLNDYDKICMESLNLYKNSLKCTNQEVLSFLFACYTNIVTEMYLEIPIKLISVMRGRPCKSRDIEDIIKNDLSSELDINRFFSKKTLHSVVLQNDGCAVLYYGDEMKAKLHNVFQETDECPLFICLPQNEKSLEQLVLVCTKLGRCKLISSTRKNIEIVAEFDLELPENDERENEVNYITWIDCVIMNNQRCLFWGGSDELRGLVTWSFFSGINDTDLANEDFFFEVDRADIAFQEIIKEWYVNPDFTCHGNLLTLWNQMEDSKYNEEPRSWTLHQKIMQGKYIVEKNIICNNGDTEILQVWGCHQQYFVLKNDGKVVPHYNYIEKDIILENKKAISFCMLFNF